MWRAEDLEAGLGSAVRQHQGMVRAQNGVASDF